MDTDRLKALLVEMVKVVGTPEQNVFLGQPVTATTPAATTAEWQAVYDKIAAQNPNAGGAAPATPYVAPVATTPVVIPQPAYPAAPADPRDMSFADTKRNYDALLAQSEDAAKNYAMQYTNWYRELGLTPQEINSYSPGNGSYFGTMGAKACALSGSLFGIRAANGVITYYTLPVPAAENGMAMQFLAMARGG